MWRTWPFGQVEREVGAAGDPGVRPAELRLLAVVDVLGEAGEAQHVLGHPLPPLTAGLRAGERFAERPGGVGERLRRRRRGPRSDWSTSPKRWALVSPSLATSSPRRLSSWRTSIRTASRFDPMTSCLAASSASSRSLVDVIWLWLMRLDLAERRGDGLVAVVAVAFGGVGGGVGDRRGERPLGVGGDTDEGRDHHDGGGDDDDHNHASIMTKGCDSVWGWSATPEHPPRSHQPMGRSRTERSGSVPSVDGSGPGLGLVPEWDHEAAVVEAAEAEGGVVDAEVGVQAAALLAPGERLG